MKLAEDYGWVCVDQLPRPDLEVYIGEARELLIKEGLLREQLSTQLQVIGQPEEWVEYLRAQIRDSDERRHEGFQLLAFLRQCLKGNNKEDNQE